MLAQVYRYHRGSFFAFGLLALCAAAAFLYGGTLVASGISTARAAAEVAETKLQKLVTEAAPQPFDNETVADVWQRYVAFRELTRGSAEDSLTVARLLEGLAERHRLVALNYDFGPVTRADVGRVGLFGYQSAGRGVTIDAGAILDSDVLSFVADAMHVFSGAVALRELSIDRRQAIDSKLLEEISAGSRPEIVHLHLRLDWQTPVKRG